MKLSTIYLIAGFILMVVFMFTTSIGVLGAMVLTYINYRVELLEELVKERTEVK